MAVSNTMAVKNAAAEVADPTTWYKGLCLKFTREMLGIPMHFRSAIEAWNGANKRHTQGVPPAGAPVFWRGGEFGHIALSAGGGWCYSTDIRRTGRADRVPISEIKARWGYTYLGWSEDLNEVKVNLPAPPAPPSMSISLKAVQYSARNPGHYLPGGTDDVVAVKAYIVRHGFATDDMSFRNAYAAFQKAMGYRGTAADGIPGDVTLRAMCRTANWRLIP